MNVIIIDIGGTNIKYARTTDGRNLVDKGQVPTEAKLGADKVYGNVCSIIDQFSDLFELTGIAVSSAGQVDAGSGSIIYATEGIPGYTGYRLRDLLRDRYAVKVSVENDVNCAALGEMWRGDVSADSFVALTLGTGIGGSIVIDRHIHHGALGSAGELGHMTLVSGGLPCNCGYRGCFERYASAQALDKSIEEHFGVLNTAEFFEWVRRSDPEAESVFGRWIDYLTDGIKSIVHIFNPSEILIGGGITVQGEFLRNAIYDALMPKIMASFRKGLRVDLMSLGNDANLYGALYWYLESEMDSHAI